LVQSQLFQKNISIEIEDAGIIKKTTNKNGTSELNYSFESITNDRVYVLEDNKALLVFAVIMTILSIIILGSNGPDSPSLVYLAIGGVFGYFYYKSRVRKLYLSTSDGQTLFLLADIPNRDDVVSFVETVYSARNRYLLSKYSTLTKHVDYASQLNNLNWLLNNRVLSKGEYDAKVQELNSLFNSTPGSTPIGFYKSGY
jgi:hypothetical protein